MPEDMQLKGGAASVVKQSAGIGVVGAALMQMTTWLTDPEYQSLAQTLVPFFSGIVIATSVWVWSVFKPGSAESFRLRRQLNKKRLLIGEMLGSPDLSDNERKELTRKLHLINHQEIDSYD